MQKYYLVFSGGEFYIYPQADDQYFDIVSTDIVGIDLSMDEANALMESIKSSLSCAIEIATENLISQYVKRVSVKMGEKQCQF